MKMKSIAGISTILCISLLLSSCNYGLHQFLYRSDEANSRSSSVENLNAQGKAPSINGNSSFSVVVISDVHFGRMSHTTNDRPDAAFMTWLAQKKDELSAAGSPLQFCICLGDCVETGYSDEYIQYNKFADKIYDTLGLKLYSVVGNHDLFNSGWSMWKQSVYPGTSSYMFTTAQGEHKMSWYFLDSGNGTLGYNQLTDVVKKMDEDSNPKLVFTHYPIYANGIFYFTMQNETERDTLLAAFGRDKVLQVLEGHYHAGGSYQFGNLFNETIMKSYLDFHNAGILKINLESQTATIEQFSF